MEWSNANQIIILKDNTILPGGSMSSGAFDFIAKYLPLDRLCLNDILWLKL